MLPVKINTMQSRAQYFHSCLWAMAISAACRKMAAPGKGVSLAPWLAPASANVYILVVMWWLEAALETMEHHNVTNWSGGLPCQYPCPLRLYPNKPRLLHLPQPLDTKSALGLRLKMCLCVCVSAAACVFPSSFFGLLPNSFGSDCVLGVVWPTSGHLASRLVPSILGRSVLSPLLSSSWSGGPFSVFNALTRIFASTTSY